MYLFPAIDRVSGEILVQPLKSKADAWRAMQAYLEHVRTVLPRVELRLGISITGVVTVYSDRGGEFTSTWGFTQSAFDELFEQRGIRRRLNSPDMPKSGTTMVERAWRSLVESATRSLVESGLGAK